MAAVEGPADEYILMRVAALAGAGIGPVYGRHGKGYLRNHIVNYDRVARHRPWCVLADLNHDASCAPSLMAQWLPQPAPLMRLRIAVREVEAWLLADAQRLAAFLSIPVSHVPISPEDLPDPKRTLVDLARRSRSRAIKQDMVPRPGTGRSVGPAYTSRIQESAATWPRAGAPASPPRMPIASTGAFPV